MIRYFTEDKRYSVERWNGEWHVYKNEPCLKSTAFTDLFFPVGPFDSFIHAVKWLKFLLSNDMLA